MPSSLLKVTPPKRSLPSFPTPQNNRFAFPMIVKPTSNQTPPTNFKTSCLPPDLDSMLLHYPFQTIKDATSNFSIKQYIGEGSFGKVYSGELYGTQVAVKVLLGPTSNDFLKEINALSKYRHPNLVTLIGYSFSQKHFYLIFELLTTDLRAKLSEDNLNWKNRITIALDTATGLSFLHNSNPKCFHRDIKSTNILLTKSGSAKVGDFGLATLALSSQLSINFKIFEGTSAYADPLYKQTGKFSEHAEVYSFGILLLEIITSKLPSHDLVNQINKDTISNTHLLDSNAHFPNNVAIDLIKLILSCTNPNMKERPKFLSIVKQLRFLLNETSSDKISTILIPSTQASSSTNLLTQDYDEEMMLDLSLKVSLDQEKTRLRQEEEEQRDLLAALAASEREYKMNRLKKLNSFDNLINSLSNLH